MGTTNTISLTTARKRIQQLLNFAALVPAFAKRPNSVPRAILIPTNDILDILEKFGYQTTSPSTPGLLGMRLYFGLKDISNNPIVQDFELSGMLVPVIPDHNPAGTDQLGLTAEEAGSTQTNIYDYTQPCPKFCDKSSQMYSVSS